MSTLKLTLCGLSLLAVATTAAVPAFAALPTPTVKPGARLPNVGVQPLINGTVNVGTRCTGEFPDYDRSMSFFERPASICVRWADRQPVASATWELWKHKPGAADQKLASGALPAGSIGSGTHSTFDIPLSSLPKYNEGTSDQRYFVKVVSKKTADSQAMLSGRGTLIHRPKSAEAKPQPEDPYKCSPAADKHERTVTLTVPKLTVNSTTSTPGDADRDELYIRVDRLGPGNDTAAKRLPGNDDYYEAKPGSTYTTKWTNQDGKNKGRPNLWSGQLEHGQIVTLGVTMMEQDNADLGNVRSSIMDALIEVEKAALESNNSYGAIVAAVAGALTMGASLIPNTNGHDFIGVVGVRMENKCGHIRTTWTTFHEWDVPGVGTLKNDFINSGTQEAFESRLVVHSWPATGFQPEAGYAWGDFKPAGLGDSFWWVANGSSGSKYTFTLASRLLTKEEADKAKAAGAKVDDMLKTMGL